MLNKKLKTNESGRSMVEMLGVLAVIGVLSIAGIAGYTTAMNSYHANETVNQARLLASIVSTQRLLNANGGDLSDDDLKGKFTFDPATTDSIKLTATGLDSKVADRIKAMDLKIATVADGENGSLVFTFSNDMTERTGGNTGTPEESVDVGTCSNGNLYQSYNVGTECDTTLPVNVERTCTTAQDCADGVVIEGGAGIDSACCDTTTHKCKLMVYTGNYSKIYDCSTGATACNKNSDCASNEYCSFRYVDNGQTPSYVGICRELTAGTEKTENGKTFLLGNLEDFGWFSAENWCKAQGKSIVSLSSLGISADYDCSWNGENECVARNWGVFAAKGNSSAAEVYIVAGESLMVSVSSCNLQNQNCRAGLGVAVCE